ncbi:MAG: MgtC/SapB family protein [Myxococcota bacterium]|jgi:putative Mg2+ transporter-C (MgtC) family protein|nr:MgtC/SapB family protein [Myxococcota bacterium]
MTEFDPLATSFWIKVGYSIVSGGLVGLERQIRGKPVGVRTSILICLGTSIFVELGGVLGAVTGDPTRVLGQVVTGIGFLGAGVMLARGGVVSGVTTAAVIWILAAIGACIGLGYAQAGLVFAFLTISILIGVGLLESGFRRLRTGIYAHEAYEGKSDED